MEIKKRGIMLKRKLGIIFGTMFIFSLVSYILIAAFGRKTVVHGQEEETVLTSFYPVFIITRNLTQGVEGLKVANLTENHTGCLHDYQLTTKDMLLLETADLLVINGGGMELFIGQATKKLTGLTVIDSCTGMELLAGAGHDHNHGEDSVHDHFEDEPENSGLSHEAGEPENPGQNHDTAESEDSVKNHDEESEENGHVWMDMERYQMQIHTIADGLCKAFPGQESSIRANELSYSEKVVALLAEYKELEETLSGLAVVTFHDAFVYLCDGFGMEVVHSLDMDADSALSAGELAELTDEIRLHGVRYLLVEKENGDIAEQIAQETGCSVLCLDPLTSGADEVDAYLAAMRENLEKLKSIPH